MVLWLCGVALVNCADAVGEDEDNYGLEMRLYLQEEDILKPGQSNAPGILRFCTPITRDVAPAKGKGKGKGKKSRPTGEGRLVFDVYLGSTGHFANIYLYCRAQF